MSEHRQPTEIWSISLPQSSGTKQRKNCKVKKIELFPAHYWAMYWEPGSTKFYPKMPLRSESRKLFWERHYRIRVDGLWRGVGAKYVFATREEIFNEFFL